MSELTDLAPGTFCWIDLGTTDASAAKRFYGEIFGWGYQDFPMEDGSSYTMAQIRGKNVCGLYTLSEEMRSQDAPPNWLSYVAVQDVDSSTRKVPELGGSVFVEPLDVMGMGKMSVISDPAGGALALWQQTGDDGQAWVVNEHGALVWNELNSKDAAAAGAFYTSLFGWDAEKQPAEDMDYTVFKINGRPIGGMLQMTEQWGDAPSHWMVYFAIDDLDEGVAKVKELGGQVLVPPTDSPFGRMAALSDPQGAVFSIIQMSDNPPQV